MAEFKIRNPDYATRTRASFARQKFMAFLGVEIDEIAPGSVEIRLPYRMA